MAEGMEQTKEGLGGASTPVSEFREFLKKYNVVGMAIGIVMGVATTALVNSVVNSIVMPFISLLMPRGEWEKAGIVLRQAVVEKGTELYPAVKLLYGDVISAAINFLVIAIVVFMFAKYILREDKVEKK